jgi:hypothetical protein
MKHHGLFAALGFAFAFSPPALGGVILTAEEVGGDVVIAGGGTLDLSLWNGLFSAFGIFAGVAANDSVIVGSTDLFTVYFATAAQTGFTGPATIGPGTQGFFADSTTGDFFGLEWGSGFFPDGIRLLVFQGYVSGGPLSGSATFLGETIASLGLSPGTYTWTWNTTTGSDFFTVNIVPAPGALALLGMASVISGRRRREGAPRAP